MDQSEIDEVSSSQQSQIVGVCINGNKRSIFVVKWALDNIAQEENTVFKLIHVRPRVTSIPTPMGNFLPLSQVRNEVAVAYKQEVRWKISKMLLPYKKMFTQRMIEVDIVTIESDDVATAIAYEVGKSNINKLVIGHSSPGIFTRKNRNISSKISECTPNFCTVYVVSEGKLLSARPSDLETSWRIVDDNSSDTSTTSSSLSYTSSLLTDQGSATSYSNFRSPSLPMQRFQALSSINQSVLHSRDNSFESDFMNQSMDTRDGETILNSYPNNSDVESVVSRVSRLSSNKSLTNVNQSWITEQGSSSSSTPRDLMESSSEPQVNVSFELDKLRLELRHVRGMYAIAQTESLDASRKLNDLNKRRLEESVKLKEINYKEEKAIEVIKQEKGKYRDAKREANYVKECVERETMQRREAEIKAEINAREKEKLERAIVGPVEQYKRFTWEEIVDATSSFSDDLKIGMGSYGIVYKCSLHHTVAAVKVLHSREDHIPKEFQQELEVLSKIRHPHLLMLLGACPDQGCLVYEYMENGSLNDLLFQKSKKTPFLPWFDRFRIAWEIATALLFLHNSKPKPIIHRDLKPANILLDRNFVSKIGDVGLSKELLRIDSMSMASNLQNTGPVGTLCYIDPEYQRTGFDSPKSDIYAFGMVILQLLTSKPAIALTHIVENAIDEDRVVEILDPDAGQWPIEEAKELAALGLSCAELRRKDRPDLKEQVLPVLVRLKEVADKATNVGPVVLSAPPSHFICPILQEVMNDPCVAADGYTYDRQSIETWLEANDTSPMTNLPLANKNLIPNYSLISGILEWKSKRL